MHRAQQITDVIHGSITYSGIEREIIGTPIFNRLHRVLQNSMVYLTYSSNKAKRFEHSVGTMHLAGQMFYYSVCNAPPNVLEEFFSEVEKEICNWRNTVDARDLSYIHNADQSHYAKEKILNAPIPENPLYNCYTPGNLPQKYRFSYFVVFQAIRLSGLMHDLGHMPYSHIMENSLSVLIRRIRLISDPTEKQKEFLDIMDPYSPVDPAEKKNEIHEALGEQLIDKIRLSITSELSGGEDPERFFFAISYELAVRILKSTSSQNTIYCDLHRIISSVVDADRLDYCSRDNYAAGTRNDIFPYARFLSTYQMAHCEHDGDLYPLVEKVSKKGRKAVRQRFFFCPAAKSLREVQDLLDRRWRIFSDINYHHHAHKHETLMEEVIAWLGELALASQEKPAEMGYVLPLDVSSIWGMINRLKGNDLAEYQIIQLDDSWMDTVLKCRFFEEFQDNYQSYRLFGNDKNWSRFDELISTRRHYLSSFKRAADFQSFDERVYDLLQERLSDGCMEDHPMFELSGLGKSYKAYFRENRKFYCDHLLTRYRSLSSFHFGEELERRLNEKVGRNGPSLHINDCLVRLCDFGTGCDTVKSPVYLIACGKPVKLEQLCPKLDEAFRRERAVSPLFHLYFLPEYDTHHGEYYTVDTMALINLAAECTCDLMRDAVEQVQARHESAKGDT